MFDFNQYKLRFKNLEHNPLRVHRRAYRTSRLMFNFYDAQLCTLNWPYRGEGEVEHINHDFYFTGIVNRNTSHQLYSNVLYNVLRRSNV